MLRVPRLPWVALSSGGVALVACRRRSHLSPDRSGAIRGRRGNEAEAGIDKERDHPAAPRERNTRQTRHEADEARGRRNE